MIFSPQYLKWLLNNDSLSYPQVLTNRSTPWATHNIDTCTVFSTCNILLPEVSAAWLQSLQHSSYTTDLLTEYCFYNTLCSECLWGCFWTLKWNVTTFLRLRKTKKKGWLWWSYCPLTERKASLRCPVFYHWLFIKFLRLPSITVES